MQWFASLVLALALGVMGCSETSGTGGGGGDGGAGGEGGANSFDWSQFPLLIPIDSQVVVSVGDTYSFSSQPEDGGEALGSCSISLGGDLRVSEDWVISVDDVVLANFQRTLPRGSDDFFSIQIQGDFVSWGLFAEGPVEGRPDVLGKEWSNRGDGVLEGDCEAGDGAVVFCSVSWTGEAVENFTLEEVRRATVEMTCLFAQVAPCTLSCVDGNPCTLGVCMDSRCVYRSIGEGRMCDVQPGVDEFCTAGGQCAVATGF